MLRDEMGHAFIQPTIGRMRLLEIDKGEIDIAGEVPLELEESAQLG